MELFVRGKGLLITMTTISDNFYAPNRFDTNDNGGLSSDSTTRPAFGWRALFSSFFVHVLGVAIIIVAGQWHLVEREPAESKPLPAPVQATLYFPPIPKPQSPSERTSSQVKSDTPQSETPLEAEKPTPKQQVVDEKPVLDAVAPIIKQANDVNEPPPAASKVPPPASQATPTTPNQRAGRLTLSPKEAVANYFDGYNQQQIQGLAQQESSAYQSKKQSPDLVDTRKGEPEPLIPPRPVKNVNCASTTNKVITFLSGMAGGTLTCTKMDDHNRFIDARVQKTPKEGQ